MRLERKDAKGALERCRKQAEASPKNPAYRALLGQLYFQSKNLDAARKEFQEGLALDLNSVPSMMGLLGVEQSQGTEEAAIARYRQKVRENSRDTVSALVLGGLLEAKGDVAGARSAYEQVLAARPDSVVAANNLAFALAEYEPTSQKLEQAEKLVTSLLEKYRREPSIADTAAWVYYRKGEPQKARDLLPVLAEGAKGNPAISYHLGMIYLKLGEPAKAKERLQSAVKAGKPFPGKAEAEKALKEMG
jgi:tetratricopeptide (TPR) repeat protein